MKYVIICNFSSQNYNYNMERSYLEFEKPIEEIKDQINQTKEIGEKGKVDINATVNDLEKKLSTTTKNIFNNLTPWQKSTT